MLLRIMYVQSTKCDGEFVHSIYDFELQLKRKITRNLIKYHVLKELFLNQAIDHCFGQKCTQATLLDVA